MDAPAPTERSVYAPPASSRIIGLAGTVAIFAAAVAGFFITISQVVPVKPPSALTVVNLRAEASPPETPPQEKEAPKPVEKKEQSAPRRVQPVEPIIVPVAPVSVPIPVTTPSPADPSPKEPETAAPSTMPAPPAPQVASNAHDTWEGRVLAALHKERRYPRAAMARRQQGVPYIRFVMDREGKVLSSRLERSSGFPELDREAVALARRASPLPKPPDDKPGDTLELVVPVEFFMR
ncbi:TonB family protein [Sandaracinobacter sp. RS1-74]|uniref:TonB family protein n=1 Tax=Sandaracinobacteroides sayramensis TaxID=2913411 RepID=UPI001EDB4AA6|nr:TonB family protein [Sandaracinobacteroides sayramensis]MCG2840657.1 TonB family protein [Sandaracinobacteroides sayramensis]